MSEEVKAAAAPAKPKKAMNTLVIIFSVVVAACLATWLIPAGEFDRVKVGSRSVVDAASFHWE